RRRQLSEIEIARGDLDDLLAQIAELEQSLVNSESLGPMTKLAILNHLNEIRKEIATYVLTGIEPIRVAVTGAASRMENDPVIQQAKDTPEVRSTLEFLKKTSTVITLAINTLKIGAAVGKELYGVLE